MHSEHEQRMLDQRSGAELDRHALRATKERRMEQRVIQMLDINKPEAVDMNEPIDEED
jgi:hypothetical protein